MVNAGSLIGALLLGGVYLSCNYIHSLTALFRRRWLSFSSGVSVAYVFVDVLPQLEMQQRAMAPSILGAAVFPEKRIYLFALLGFVVFYGLALGAYVVAMALHLVAIDQELVADLGAAYGRTFRWGLPAGVVTGCSIGTSGWIPAAAFSRFYAFIAGGVVLLSAKAELPEGTGGRFSWFVLGAALTAAVLLVA